MCQQARGKPLCVNKPEVSHMCQRPEVSHFVSRYPEVSHFVPATQRLLFLKELNLEFEQLLLQLL